MEKIREILSSENAKVVYRTATITSLSVTSFYAIHHIGDANSIANEAQRQINQAGIRIFEDYNQNRIKEVLDINATDYTEQRKLRREQIISRELAVNEERENVRKALETQIIYADIKWGVSLITALTTGTIAASMVLSALGVKLNRLGFNFEKNEPIQTIPTPPGIDKNELRALDQIAKSHKNANLDLNKKRPFPPKIFSKIVSKIPGKKQKPTPKNDIFKQLEDLKLDPKE